ncbi:unnamed protein product [Mytilus coruscus]|uniref:Uncharacterized protein n=1 Tax=Mytilus coruscus TaxID=42192 RepID=A0A6J8E0Y3_MYTCO|nr:unnamed protein product [Mytilus coruscus]
MTSKRFKLIEASDDQRPGISSSNVEEIDWTKCIICQNITDELLQYPTSAKRINIGAGYVTLEENLVKFKDLQSLRSTINLNALDGGSGLQNTMYKNNAKWHKTCYLKFNSTQLKRAQKRHQVDTDDMSENTANRSRKFTRSSLPCKISMKEYVCFFCGSNKPDENLHEVTRRNVDIHVRQCALKLQDTALLAKLTAGDLVAQEAKYHVRCLANLYRKASRVSIVQQIGE